MSDVHTTAPHRLLILFLNKVECLEDLLTAFLEVGVNGATVVDSVGMGRIISHQVPIFAGLQSAFPGTSPSNRTILAVVEEAKVREVALVAQDVVGSFDEPGNGLMVTLPITEMFGFRTDL